MAVQPNFTGPGQTPPVPAPPRHDAHDLRNYLDRWVEQSEMGKGL